MNHDVYNVYTTTQQHLLDMFYVVSLSVNKIDNIVCAPHYITAATTLLNTPEAAESHSDVRVRIITIASIVVAPIERRRM